MNEDLEVFDDGDFNTNLPKKRPAFIIVLAILSWLFVASGVITGIYGSFSSVEKQTESIDLVIE